LSPSFARWRWDSERGDLRHGERGVNELALFAGAGGGILGGYLLGWRTVCAVEQDPYARSVLLARQNDGTLAPFPIWDDIRTFDGLPWRGAIDVVSGGFPCQDISAAGGGDGLDGERSGLWHEMARVVRQVRPQYVFVENSPILTSRGLHRVLGDLAEMGCDARWGVLGAADVGAPHLRERIWILAYPNVRGWRQTLPEGTTPTGMTPEGRKQTVCLERYVQQVERGTWATPQARDYRSGSAERWDDKRRSRNLNDQVAKFPTPTVAMGKGSSGGALTRKTGKSRRNDRLDYAVEGEAKNGRLNPQWVEWLMGWPIGWTELQPLATDRFREWSRSHGESSERSDD
jgi:DNA (cytosine-5)-methyltransferase 1